MARKNRHQQIDENVPGVYHITSRCVRRAFLCGEDYVTGRSFDHRREWIEQRLMFLAKIFLIDMLGHGIMGNHLHNILRNRPDLARNLSKEEVAMRWCRLTRGPDVHRTDTDKDPAQRQRNRRRERKAIKKLLRRPKDLIEYRRRLSSISWLMSYLKQPIAVQANKEDGLSGRFWEGRFRSVAIETATQLIAAMVYVDLNPIAAGAAETPEESRYTSVYNRIEALKRRKQLSRKYKGDRLCAKHRRLCDREDVHQQCDDWLSPIHEQDEQRLAAPSSLESRVNEKLEQKINRMLDWALPARASNKGCLSMTLEQYLELVDWTGRQQRQGKRGRIPQKLAPILKRLGMENAKQWRATIADYGKQIFGRYFRPCNMNAELDMCVLETPGISRRQMFF